MPQFLIEKLAVPSALNVNVPYSPVHVPVADEVRAAIWLPPAAGASLDDVAAVAVPTTRVVADAAVVAVPAERLVVG